MAKSMNEHIPLSRPPQTWLWEWVLQCVCVRGINACVSVHSPKDINKMSYRRRRHRLYVLSHLLITRATLMHIRRTVCLHTICRSVGNNTTQKKTLNRQSTHTHTRTRTRTHTRNLRPLTCIQRNERRNSSITSAHKVETQKEGKSIGEAKREAYTFIIIIIVCMCDWWWFTVTD